VLNRKGVQERRDARATPRSNRCHCFRERGQWASNIGVIDPIRSSTRGV
jgi:hypothetical protein